MNPMPPPPPPSGPVVSPSEAELHAYADEQLTPERRAEVEAWLAQRPAESARVQAWIDQTHALRSLFDPVLTEPVPSALARAASRPAPRWFGSLAAGLVVAVASGGAGWMLRGSMPSGHALPTRTALEPTPADPLALSTAAGTSFAERAAVAHAVYTPELRRPVEVDAAHEDQLVTWLSKRMGTPMRPPHLQAEGFELEGGRLLPGEHGPVAQFMYRDADGRRLTLYVSNEMAPPAGSASPATTVETAFRYMRRGKVNVFYWVDGPFGYAISAEADRDTLARVSEAVYRQLASAAP
jgi:anti-sigma factor RsiW